jgi:predicted kinase
MLIIVRGASGSGKSYFADVLKKVLKTDLHFEADMFFETSKGYYWKPKLLPIAHQWCLANATEACFDNEKHVIVSNTFIHEKHVQPYIEMAMMLGMKYVVVRVMGEFENQHNVPTQVVENMRKSLELIEGEYVVDNNSQNGIENMKTVIADIMDK